MKRFSWAVICTVTLTVFTTYMALDTFVLSNGLQKNATGENTAMFDSVSEDTASGTLDDTSSGVTADAASDEAEDENSTASVTPSSGNFGRRGSGHGKRSDGESGHSSGRSSGDSNLEEDSTSESTATADSTTPDSSASEVTTADAQTYTNDNASITLSEYYVNNTRIYVADVTLTSARYLKTAFADDTYGRNVTAHTSEIAEANQAILAINGDYYGAQENGYVIRNGIVYRESSDGEDLCCLYADGTLRIVNSDEMSAEELVADGVWQAWNFGPALIENQSITVSTNDEVGRSMASNPRTAIGMIDSNHYVFVVSDGRTSESEGLSLYELAQFMQGFGVQTAYNLDGGGSSTLYFNGEVINNPTTSGRTIKERGVSDIVYIGA